MGRPDARRPRWREDFPISFERDHYVSRRELAKFLALGSALLAAANALLAGWAKRRTVPAATPRRIEGATALEPGATLSFRFPTEEDPCILLRRADRTFVAYSQVCTHLSCAVVYSEADQALLCPCHRGFFSCEDGRPTAGPPERPLPRIRLAERDGALWAIAREV